MKAELSLHERISILEEENRQLKKMLAPPIEQPRQLNLTRSESRIVSALLRASPRTVRQETIRAVLDTNSEGDGALVAVFVCKIKKKLVERGIKIGCSWGVGYFLDVESATRLRDLIAAEGLA